MTATGSATNIAIAMIKTATEPSAGVAQKAKITAATKRNATVWVSLLTYFLVFLGMDFLFYGDIQNTLRAMAPSSPVLAAAIVVMALDDGQTTISHRRLGEWSSLAVVFTVL